jgi:CTP synthase (UTP-ammonia lyase)
MSAAWRVYIRFSSAGGGAIADFDTDAHSVEMSAETPNPVIIFMPEGSKTHLGGTMRLGLRPTVFQPGSEWSKIRQLYSEAGQILERHRHRYEVNPEYVDRLTAAGLNFVGKDDMGERMEIVELKEHPYFVGVQFHPEYMSRVLNPSKPYLGFVAAASGYVPLSFPGNAKLILMNPLIVPCSSTCTLRDKFWPMAMSLRS